MTRTEALAVATATHTDYINAYSAFLFGRRVSEPVEADFGVRHGWTYVGEFAFSSDETLGKNNQPYSD